MRTVMQLSGKMVSLFTQALAWLTALLWKVVNSLRASYFRLSLSVVNLFNQLVSHAQKVKVLLVNLTTQVLLIKSVVTTALVKIWAIGLQLVTIARQTLQAVKQALKKNK
jgi:hypothetical protein